MFKKKITFKNVFLFFLLIVLILFSWQKVIIITNKFKIKKIENIEKNINIRINDSLVIPFVFIQAGSFKMGDNNYFGKFLAYVLGDFDVNDLDEGPERTITITKPFYISKYRINTLQYCCFLNSINYDKKWEFFPYTLKIKKIDSVYLPLPGTEKCAFNGASWIGVDSFCKWLSQEKVRKFRLPTEAEWEFVAQHIITKHTTQNNMYSDTLEPIKKSNNQHKDIECLSIKNLKLDSTPEGVIGMFGDMGTGEWVNDFYGKYNKRDLVDPKGAKPDSNSRQSHVVRGRLSRVRGRYESMDTHSFRVVLEIDDL